MNAIIVADVITMVVFAVGIVIYTDRAIQSIRNSQTSMHEKIDASMSGWVDMKNQARIEQKDLLNIFVEYRREDRLEHKEIVDTLRAMQRTMAITEKVMDAWISKNLKAGDT